MNIDPGRRDSPSLNVQCVTVEAHLEKENAYSILNCTVGFFFFFSFQSFAVVFSISTFIDRLNANL